MEKTEEETLNEINYWIIKLSKFKSKIMAIVNEVEQYKKDNDIDDKIYTLKEQLNNTSNNILNMEESTLNLQNTIDDIAHKVAPIIEE